MKKDKTIRCLLLGLFLLSTVGILYAGGVMERGSGNLITEEFDFRDFTDFDVSGSWDVQIIQGPYGVSVAVDDNILKYVRVEKRGNTLSLSTKSGRFLRATFKATISMPDLEMISTSGSTRITFSGFDSAELSIKTSGSSRITGTACVIEQMKIDSSGSSDLDLKDCEIIDALIELSGSTRVKLTMAGGDLTGKMLGSGSIIYYGEVDNLNVRSSGSSRIMKK